MLRFHLQPSEAVKPILQLRVECLFGEHSAGNIWFPPFNQVTQAWNAQLCQTESILDAWETRACPGYWCKEKARFPFFLPWMAALTSQQLGTTGGTNNKVQAKSTLLCCRAILISFCSLLWLQKVRHDQRWMIGALKKGSLSGQLLTAFWPCSSSSSRNLGKQ